MMTFATNHSIQKIIKTVRIRLMLINLYHQLLTGLSLATSILAVFSLLHVFYHPMPVQYAIALAVTPLLLLFAYTLIFCTLSDEMICKKADRMLDSQSLILTAWDAENSNPVPSSPAYQHIKHQINLSYHNWQSALGKFLSIRIHNKFYVLIVCILCGVLVLSIYPGAQNPTANTHLEQAIRSVSESTSETEPKMVNKNTVKDIRSFFDTNKTDINNRLESRSTTSIDKIVLSQPPSSSTSSSRVFKQRNNNPLHAGNKSGPTYKEKLNGEKFNHKGTGYGKNAMTSTPGSQPADKTTQSSSNRAHVATTDIPVRLNKGSELSTSSNTNHFYAQANRDDTGDKARWSKYGINDKNNIRSAVHYDADFPAAIQAYIKKYELSTEHYND